MSTCDLCSGTSATLIAAENDHRCRTVLCNDCGLLFASPPLDREALFNHYDEEFAGDSGSRAATGVERSIAKEEAVARDWALPLILRHIDPADTRALDLRCRTGALSELLKDAGAAVVSVDPFQPNLDYARDRRGLSDLVCLPLADFGPLPEGLFDLITGLTVHVLAHLYSPRAFLQQALSRLKPGGLLILDEKDVLKPRRHRAPSLFDTGPAHTHHFTDRTLGRLAAASGFEVIQCATDPVRATAFRHVVLVARRPTAADHVAAPAIFPAVSASQVRRAELAMRARSAWKRYASRRSTR